METTKINGRAYAKLLAGGAETLRTNRTVVNDLNVFPVPDGDTGDNMYMTINAGVTSLADYPTLSEVADAAAHGMLLGARGNSGVILSRIFSGIAKGLNGLTEAGPSELAQAMLCGITESYNAVANPVDGTILSVYRDGVKAASAKQQSNPSFEFFFDNLIDEFEASLQRTPELLPVLKDAGVIDSGGAGLLYIANGMRDALLGKEFTVSAPVSSEKEAPVVDFSSFTESSILEFGYCTEFLLRLQSSKVNVENFNEKTLIEHLKAVGDSVVAFRDGSIIKVHVHTMKPGEILNYCQQFGEFLTLKVENMMLQHNNSNLKNTYNPPRRKTRYGLVAVAAGDGLKRFFKDLGADEIVDGGQSMNPSTEDFIKAFRKISAETIFVLPNNKNVIMSATQAAELYTEANVVIIPSKNIGEGYIAASCYDSSAAKASDITAAAAEAMSSVTTCMVSKASRDVASVSAKAGDYIGFVGRKIYSGSEDRKEALRCLLEKVNAGSKDVIVLAHGASVPDSEATEMLKLFSAKYPMSEFIPLKGGQPVYDYIIILQ